MFPALCPYSSHSILYRSILLSLTHIYIGFIDFWVVEKLNDFNFFWDFHFFGLQFTSFIIRQYWEFARQPFPKFRLIAIYFDFRPA